MKFTDVSFVKFTPENIRKVAKHAGVTEERVRTYLKDKDDQDKTLFNAFYAVTNMYPINKFP